MTKNVLIISSTMRNNGNSESLAKEFAKGAQDSNNKVEFISLRNKKINFCTGCLSCQKTKTCFIKDDTNDIVEKMKNSDVIVFATPIYYYEMSGQLKTLLDRANPLFSSDYKFRDVYFLTCAADTNPNCSNIAINGIRGWISCFSKANLKQTLTAFGVEGAGDIKNTNFLTEAYKIGQAV